LGRVDPLTVDLYCIFRRLSFNNSENVIKKTQILSIFAKKISRYKYSFPFFAGRYKYNCPPPPWVCKFEKNIPCPLNIPDSLEDALEFYSSGMI
jgi:hypothetical protein